MPTVHDSRNSFIAKVRSFINSSEERYFAEIIDDFIAWSAARATGLAFNDKDYDQHVVSFLETTSGVVLWSAFPRIDDGAKLNIVPKAGHLLGPDLKKDALSLLKSLSREPLADESQLRVPFRALKRQESRDKLKALLDRIAAHLAMPQAASPPPAV